MHGDLSTDNVATGVTAVLDAYVHLLLQLMVLLLVRRLTFLSLVAPFLLFLLSSSPFFDLSVAAPAQFATPFLSLPLFSAVPPLRSWLSTPFSPDLPSPLAPDVADNFADTFPTDERCRLGVSIVSFSL